MKSPRFFAFWSCLSCFSLTVFAQNAPYDPSPFTLTGAITAITLDPAGGRVRGGTIAIDGVTIIVPQNLLATLPSITVAWPELFTAAGAPMLAGFPGTTWQATVFGNRVNNVHIAGLVYIAQQQNRLLTGFINSIDTATGHFHVTGSFANGAQNTGIECFLNDPVGRFGLAYTADPLWSVDPDNPSIGATTGFPMCIPRSNDDPACPAKNRPIEPVTGRPTTKLTFKDPASLSANDPDPRLMMPLVIGDYITFSGVEINGVLAVYSLKANLGVYTAPGSKPAYVTVEEAIYAVVTTQGGENGETRAVAFTTDPSITLQWFAMDVDPCTGAVTERNLLLVAPTTAAPVGRAVFRLGKTNVSPATRQVGFRLSSGTTTGPGGIIAGQFIQPIFDYTFPELTVFGDPMFPLLFNVIPYLALGSGPYTPGNLLATPPTTPTIVGQLSPWPNAITPVPTSCPPPLPPSTTLTTSTLPPSTPTPPPVKDTVTILSATAQNGKGTTTVTVSASTNNLTALLSLAVAGAVPIPPTPMNSLGNGRWSLSVAGKDLKPTGVTVTSSAGGSATQPV